ncbi:hypothetical protein ENSA5_30800 [Enhygromyxa salina]|uniref:Lipoprotein n=1 Tax=Enhygromyxa salina TaxID=215803 RepID=A0A2S9XZ11_9BACT|nr:hypothetical protein [Enhygromyxa salina]PRP98095.1 hypothetical protein ENSA5_30800 [Enhygromyxa salina]
MHRRLLRLACGSCLALACAPDQDLELARAWIGPEGGAVNGGAVTVDIPAGALASETEIVLYRAEASLTTAGYEQRGDAVTIEPVGLRLALPATVTVTVTESSDDTSVLVAAADRIVAYPGEVAYLEYLGDVALAHGGTPTLTLVAPELGSSPTQPGGDFVDKVHFELELDGTERVDLLFTAWDLDGEQTLLNGKGHCGFEVAQLVGGSLTAGCAAGRVTASLNATDDKVSFDLLPHHLVATDAPVSVGVIAGDGELGYSLGYFQFDAQLDSGGCQLEECGGAGL